MASTGRNMQLFIIQLLKFDYIQFSKFHTHNGDDTLPKTDSVLQCNVEVRSCNHCCSRKAIGILFSARYELNSIHNFEKRYSSSADIFRTLKEIETFTITFLKNNTQVIASKRCFSININQTQIQDFVEAGQKRVEYYQRSQIGSTCYTSVKFHNPNEIHETPGVARLIKHKRNFREVFSQKQRSCAKKKQSNKVDYINCKQQIPQPRETGI